MKEGKALVNKRNIEWLPEYSRLPSVTWHSGDEVTLHHIRNFRYPADGPAIAGWYRRRFSLSDVQSTDLVLSYWGSRHIAHVFLSFRLGSGQRLAFSVETRRQEGQPWSAWRGFLNAYPVIYVAGDERDLIGQRLCRRQERMYLYPMSLSAGHSASLMHDYLLRISRISRDPEYYHTIWNNCTTNILRHGRTLSPDMRYHWQLLLSGHADRYCYNRGLLKNWGLINQRASFDVLKSTSRLLPPARIDRDFSDRIRMVHAVGPLNHPMS
ncbi:DUF4105 domain-containing protein [Erwinia sp. HDF1-3R]|uniref:lipoprotein N-acyltransferase Lnb domain-containing protein n=1 Tax=Erwinia sp. HDF1-3R TaxID=3141543 RepID=UPI0031F596A4